MTDNHKNFISKLNSFHIIILGCILGSIFILNSNSVNRQKETMKLNQEKSVLFNKIISQRRLGEETAGADDGYIYETDEVCSRASDKLQDYYRTGDLTKIDLDNTAIKCEDKDSDYMKALIDLFKSLVEDDKKEDNDNTLRNLLDDDTEESIKSYGNRILPWLVFLCVSVLSIIGWIVCCFTCCFNCCCCCCCKNNTICKIFWFIFSFLFYALVVAVCIYGLTQTSKIFTGIADTECSLLQFFDVILFGEKKKDTPKWIGVEHVNILLNKMHSQLNNMANEDLLGNLDLLMEEIDWQKGLFKSELESSYEKFYKPESPTTYLSQYTQDYSSDYYIGESSNKKNLNGKYVLDIIKQFGKYDSTTKTFEEDTVLSSWNTEFSEIGDRAGTTLTEARNNFNVILTKNLKDIMEALEKGQDELSKLRDPFNDVYDDISDFLYDASDILDKNGKLAVNLVFGVLGFMNLALGVLMFFICLFSTKTCVECTFFRCIFKFMFHILWNFLALCMILSFLIGSLLALIGQVGGDMMSFVSYVVSEENFQAGSNAVLLNKLGEGKDILSECIIGDGNLTQQFGLNDMTKDFNSINEAQTEITGYLAEFQQIKESYPVYFASRQALENRTEFIDDTYLIRTPTSSGDDIVNKVSLNEVINKLNSAIGSSINERWDKKDGDKGFKCLEGDNNDDDHGTTEIHPLNDLLHPWTCEPNNRDWVLSSNDDVKNYAKIATDIIDILKNANGTNTVQKNYYDVLEDLKDKYTPYLQTYLDVLGFFNQVIEDLISIVKAGIGDSNDTFSFLNGKFIQTNLKVILKYLKYSLGQDVYTVGICLIIVGCSLVLSISSTLLLSALINAELETNKKMEPQTEIKEYPQDNEGRVIEYKY